MFRFGRLFQLDETIMSADDVMLALVTPKLKTYYSSMCAFGNEPSVSCVYWELQCFLINFCIIPYCLENPYLKELNDCVVNVFTFIVFSERTEKLSKL